MFPNLTSNDFACFEIAITFNFIAFYVLYII